MTICQSSLVLDFRKNHNILLPSSSTYAIVASSFSKEDPTFLKAQLSHFKKIIAADGGLSMCSKLGIIPEYWVGDMDSCQESLLDLFPHIHRTNLAQYKDETDLEIATKLAFDLYAEHVMAFCALGGRTDHLLTNMQLATRYPSKLYLDSYYETIFAIHHSCHLSLEIGQTLSLIPLNGPVLGVHSEGLKWELKNQDFNKHFVGISNIATNNYVQISVAEGDLLCIIQKY